MRQFHRWLSVFFGILILWIAGTGLLSQVAPMVNRGAMFADDDHGPRVAPAMPAGFVCPPNYNCRPKPKPGGWNVGAIHDLHSGETFGPVGTILSLLSSLALLFFAFSGLWMYIQMFRTRGRNRAARGEKNRLFW